RAPCRPLRGPGALPAELADVADPLRDTRHLADRELADRHVPERLVRDGGIRDRREEVRAPGAPVPAARRSRARGPQSPRQNRRSVTFAIVTRSSSRSCARSHARSCIPEPPPVTTMKESSPPRVTVRSHRIPPLGVSIE